MNPFLLLLQPAAEAAMASFGSGAAGSFGGDLLSGFMDPSKGAAGMASQMGAPQGNPYTQEAADRVSGGMTDMSNYPGAQQDETWGTKLGHRMQEQKYQDFGMSGMQAPQMDMGGGMQGLMSMARRTGQEPYQEFAPISNGLGGPLSQYMSQLRGR